MDEHMPPQDPNDPDNTDNSTDDDQTDVWQETGSREPLRPLTHDEAMALGAQGLGGAAVVKRYEDHQIYIGQGIGTNEPPLENDARAAAAAESLNIQQHRLDARRTAALAMPDGSEKSDELARIQTIQMNLDQKRSQLQ